MPNRRVIDCQKCKDRPVDRDRFIGHPWPTLIHQIGSPSNLFIMNLFLTLIIIDYDRHGQHAGRIRPARPFYAARRHLQKHKLRSRIKPKTFDFFKRNLRTSRPFLLFTAGAYLGGALSRVPPTLTLPFSKKEQN